MQGAPDTQEHPLPAATASLRTALATSVRRRPTVRVLHREPWLLRYIAAAGYSTATIGYVISILTPDPDPSDHAAFAVLALIDAVIAIVLFTGSRLPFEVIKLMSITLAIVQISVTVIIADPIGGTLLYYVWPASTNGYFCRRREQVANIGILVVAVSLASFFARSDVSSTPFITAFSVINVFVLITVFTSWITGQIDDLIQELHETAATDHLTGLLNRRALGLAFEDEVEHARTTGRPLSVAVFDLDHFKRVNDRFGHAAGDEALRRFTAVLRGTLGRRDLAARSGGEEFTVLLPGRDLDAATEFAWTVARSLERLTADDAAPLTTSAGVVQFGPGRDSTEALLVAADRALYGAKDAGRNRVQASPASFQG